ncbi:alpha/beta fold hydrolase [Roseococcus sp. DSY-14]|uniref:alpha/beta fold hydrolase n=1 Tax=Roseococcus sp. DSY-14 TaxID=3369650 RepID=UPI00387B7F1C
MRLALLILLALVLLGAIWLWTPDRPRGWLEARYAQPPSTFVTAAGIRLHLRDTGPRDAPAILLVHGFAAHLRTWDDLAPLLEDRFRVVRLDLPGFGLSGPDPAKDYSDARMGAVLLALMDGLGIGRFHLVGASMGGRIAFALAAAHPARVERLALFAPDGFRDGGAAPARMPWWARLVPWVMPDWPLRRILAATYADPALMDDRRFALYRDMLRAPGVRQAMLDRAKDLRPRDPVPELQAVQAPTLLLWGAADRLVPPARAADFAAALRRSETVILPGTGHVPMEEAPAATAAALRRFLEP